MAFLRIEVGGEGVGKLRWKKRIGGGVVVVWDIFLNTYNRVNWGIG